MEPTLTFIYNTSTNDVPYDIWGDNEDYRVMNTASGTGIIKDKIIITGGGILNTLPTPTCASGTRDATIKPTYSSYVINQTYVETDTLMYNVPMAGFGGINYLPYRYVFGVKVDGIMYSDLYLEAWSDITFSTVNLEVLQGTENNGWKSMINAIRTTHNEPPWSPEWSGMDAEGAFLRGDTERLGLNNASVVQDEIVYFNIYIRLPTDCSTFHAQPAICFRYLYT